MGFFSELGKAFGLGKDSDYTTRTAAAQKYKTADELNKESEETAQQQSKEAAANASLQASNAAKQSTVAQMRQTGNTGLTANLAAASAGAQQAGNAYTDTYGRQLGQNRQQQLALRQSQDQMQQDAIRNAEQERNENIAAGKQAKSSAFQGTMKGIAKGVGSALNTIGSAVTSDENTKTFITDSKVKVFK